MWKEPVNLLNTKKKSKGNSISKLIINNQEITKDKDIANALRTTVPFVTADLEIFHCIHHPVIPKSDLYFTFCSTLNALSKRTSK